MESISSHSHSGPSPLTSSTTPPQPSSPNPQPTHDENDTSDIWASSSPPSPSLPLPNSLPYPTTITHPQQEPVLSELPSLRRQHVTSGYREGLSIGKARVIQSAFDEGYPIGVGLALRVGKVLGVLEGCVAALTLEGGAGRGIGRKLGSVERCEDGRILEKEETLKFIRALLERARRELDVAKILEGIEEEVLVGARDIMGLKGVEAVVKRWEGLVMSGFEKQEVVDGSGRRTGDVGSDIEGD